MYFDNPDFVFTVTRDFVRNCQTPVLILPDDIPAHPVRDGDGDGDARAESRGEHVSVERTEGANPAGGSPDALVPAGASAVRSRPA